MRISKDIYGELLTSCRKHDRERKRCMICRLLIRAATLMAMLRGHV
jgi:hypothetical protein